MAEYEQLAMEVPDGGKYPERDFSHERRTWPALPFTRCLHTNYGDRGFRCKANAITVLQFGSGKRGYYCAEHLSQHWVMDR